MRTQSRTLPKMLLLAAAVCTAPGGAQTYTVLYNFTGTSDGGYPEGNLIRDAAGNLYGTTNEGVHGYGSVFKLSPSGSLTVLYGFAGPPTDGGGSAAGVFPDSAGNLYGTTTYGGAPNSTCTYGCGVVFKLAPNGTETLLHTFSGGADEDYPYGGVIRDSAGSIFGTTGGEGADPDNGGVFKIDPAGILTELHSFAGPPTDGRGPLASLVRDAQGNLYGTTSAGGTVDNLYCPNQCGIVFKVDPAGNETILHSFAGYPSDGDSPWAGVIRDSAGTLYGTTQNGGTSNAGVVYELSPSGIITLLHSFAGSPNDGGDPLGGVVRDAAGNFYGTTSSGGVTSRVCSNIGCGVVYKLDPSGNETILHRFTGSDGRFPYAGVILDYSGNLYGATFYGGSDDFGVVFKISAAAAASQP